MITIKRWLRANELAVCTTISIIGALLIVIPIGDYLRHQQSRFIYLVSEILGLLIITCHQWIYARFMEWAPRLDNYLDTPAIITRILSSGIHHRVSHNYTLRKSNNGRVKYGGICVLAPKLISHAYDFQLRSDSYGSVMIDFIPYSLQCTRINGQCYYDKYMQLHLIRMHWRCLFLKSHEYRYPVYVHPGVGWPIHIVFASNNIGISSALFRGSFKSCWFSDYNRNRVVFVARNMINVEKDVTLHWSLYHRRVWNM